MDQTQQRYWQIDTARGIAVLLMITYHTLFDLDYLHIVSLPLRSFGVRILLYPIGSLFLVLVGFSLVLSYKRYLEFNKSIPPFSKYVKRGLFLFFLALAITIVTWIYPHEGFIVFGVLHCISLSIILSYWFIPRPTFALTTGGFLIILGVFFNQITISSPYLFWIGLKTKSFYTLDYFPLLPWLGVVLIGVFIGQKMYPHLKKGHGNLKKTSKIVTPFEFLGRNALILYFVHQPVLFGILFLIFDVL